jgi:hypothetical protein
MTSDLTGHTEWRPVKPRAILATVATFLAIGALFFPSAGWDDAYITYWSAHALSAVGRIINVNGQLFEQSSSIGFVVIIAIVSKISGLDASLAGRLLSIAFGAAAIWATSRLARLVNPRVSLEATILAATCAYFVYWSFGGMEASLAALLSILLVTAISRALEDGVNAARSAAVSLICLAYVSVRPENLLILVTAFAAIAASLVIRRLSARDEPGPVQAPGRLAALFVLCAGAAATLLVMRFAYFGAFFPQPVSAKARFLDKRKVIDGLSYVLTTIQSDFVIVALLAGAAAAMVLLAYRRWRKPAVAELISAAFVAASFAFIVMSGGDGMHGGRFFVPAMPMAFVLSVALLARTLTARHLRLAVTVWVIVQLGGVAIFARRQSNSDPLWVTRIAGETAVDSRYHWFERVNHDHRGYLEAVPALEQVIDRGLQHHRPITILSGQSGFVLYHVAQSHPGDIRYYDRFGLVSRDFVDCPVSARLPRSHWGLELSVERYLRQSEAFRQCGIPPPDVIFDLFWERFPARLDQLLRDAGYVVRYQHGQHEARSTLVPGHATGRAYIAVRQELLPAAGGVQ